MVALVIGQNSQVTSNIFAISSELTRVLRVRKSAMKIGTYLPYLLSCMMTLRRQRCEEWLCDRMGTCMGSVPRSMEGSLWATASVPCRIEPVTIQVTGSGKRSNPKQT